MNPTSRIDRRTLLLLLFAVSAGAGCSNPAEEGTSPDPEPGVDAGAGVLEHVTEPGTEPALELQQDPAAEVGAMTEEDEKKEEGVATPDPAPSSLFDFAPIPLSRMIGMAELVVLGSVSALGTDTYEFRVAEVVVGEWEGRSLQVRQFHPRIFEGRSRDVPYSAGQSFLLFLIHEPEDPPSSPWLTLGYAGEGEMPVDDDHVHMPHLQLEELEPRRHEVHGVERELRRFPLRAFLELIEEYRACFTWTVERNKHVPARAADDSRVDRFRERNALAGELVRETLRALPKK